MRIASQGQSIDTNTAPTNTKAMNVQENITPNISNKMISQQIVEAVPTAGEELEVSKDVLQQAVDVVNEFLEINYSSSKFVYHEDLGRYYVTIVNRDTEEVIKEIPPKKLLDAFYEMQKMVGMIVDEKI
ncbi:flagellar protein FlaG [Lysinibacillus fusiformis]|uniref:Flagellar protein FlaG n=1 Tax=Lysinibacillus fusiformis TaxID=28031 RepID=A0A1H9M230_9BACI|nr:flagellar protein FlaG [Lysinibacillus fusiformis]SCY58565.1 flagellar protein FlaG [Lysinibacillus fusiformis]SEO15460.1 flagellar protein FlaG [Lysinibacillus fusiformis]SER17740.1 flagellar protein FlaG [Lysinibacillus fusiformis]